jgi:Putative serine dehydratase domain
MLVCFNPERQDVMLIMPLGNYPMLDLQQRYTSLVDEERISQRVIATVLSYYPGRGDGGRDEALIDAGATAFSKDTGPSGGYGDVIGKPWRLDRISQEHGILKFTGSENDKSELAVGSMVEIVGQHACLIAAVRQYLSRGCSWLGSSRFTGLSMVLRCRQRHRRRAAGGGRLGSLERVVVASCWDHVCYGRLLSESESKPDSLRYHMLYCTNLETVTHL